MIVAIAGDGGWGTAVALLLHKYGHEVRLWGNNALHIAEFAQVRENVRYLPGIKIPQEILLTSNPQEAAAGAEMLVLATPSRHLANVCARFRDFVSPDTLVVSLSKGLDENDFRRMSEVAAEVLGVAEVVVLTGPSHAEEVAREVPTAVVSAANDATLARRVQDIFNGPHFRVYTCSDPLGAEIGGAAKNVCAIASGASDGLGFGDNTRAALIARSLAEIKRLGIALGAKPETFDGLSGAGDLIVTCTSRHSRNHQVGERLGRGEKMQDILASMQMVAEGVWNAKTIHRLAAKLGVEMPIANAVYSLCWENYPAAQAVAELMGRTAKPE